MTPRPEISPTEKPQPLPEDIVAAWEKQVAKVGWIDRRGIFDIYVGNRESLVPHSC